MNAADANSPLKLPDSIERTMVLLLCGLAAIHVFVFSATFPFFNNVDEQAHLDLVFKYAHGQVPRGAEPLSKDALRYIALYHALVYLGNPADFPGEQLPPPIWTQPIEKVARLVSFRESEWQNINHEGAQPPLYYALAGGWWRAGQGCGLEGGGLLYWLRFLNILFVVALVWVGYCTARMIFPERPFLRLGVPALLAFIPQTAFYSILNDALSPLSFGVAFVCLVRWLQSDAPRVRLGMFTGLALAAAYLTKISNLPLLAVSVAAVLFKVSRLAKAGKLRAWLPALAAMALCAALPIGGWLAWTQCHFGDFTGTAAKIQFLGWTHKPIGEWWHHPIFTPHGLWTFVSGLLATFWQGEFLWFRRPLTSPATDLFYTVSSVVFVGVALAGLLPRSTAATATQRQALWLGFWSFIASVAFLAFLSVIYDFHDCFYPSRAHPYFTSGRLLLGALIPFLLLYLCGLDCALGRIKQRWAKPLALAGLILFMLISEIAIDWRIFPNTYNWFHM